MVEISLWKFVVKGVWKVNIMRHSSVLSSFVGLRRSDRYFS
jgi:hypothetical protein